MRDAGLAIAFRVRLPRFEPLAAHVRVEATFTADAIDFVRIAAREADPDTLFIERRLSIEGDTESALKLKNLLDAVELPRWLAGPESLPAGLLALLGYRATRHRAT